MKKSVSLVVMVACFVMFGCVSGLRAADPNSNLPPLSSLKLAPPCDCDKGEPCTCDPKFCACPACATGCKNKGEEVSFVGVDQAQPGFHYETRTIGCEQGRCQRVTVAVPNEVASAPFTSMPPVTGCASCGQAGSFAGSCGAGGCSTGSCGQGGSCGSGSCGRSGPVRRVFGRFFRGRGGRGCGG